VRATVAVPATCGARAYVMVGAAAVAAVPRASAALACAPLKHSR